MNAANSPVVDLGMAAPAEPAYERNGAPVSRAAFYAVACDPRRSVAVEACAGAGKTWMLVSRMLRALLGGAQPHEILAITFTKKAAGEMRERLLQWLAIFANQPLDVLAAELRARGLDEAQAQLQAPRLAALYAQVLESGRPVQIRTFHSWFAALLGAAPAVLLQEQGLPVRFELLEDDAQAVQEVWAPFWDRLTQSPALHADYMAAVARHGRSQTHKALEAALAKRVEFALADAEGVVDASLPPFQALDPRWRTLEQPSDALDGQAAHDRWHTWSRALGHEPNKTPQKAAQAIVDAWLEPRVERRMDALRRALFVAKEDRLSKHLEKYDAAQEAEAELQALCEAERHHQAWQHQQRMARLTRALIEEYASLKRRRGWIDMNDVERTALVMLSDPVLSGWVQERLDARIRHLLIDEFQDTNPLQWQALHAWLSSYAGSGGGAQAPSVFIVGDPKQSIYRFRRAEPQVFVAAQAFVRQGLGGDLLSCDHTRRNARTVIGAVNQAMLQALAQGEVAAYRAHTTESPRPGVLCKLPLLTAAPEGPAADAPWTDAPEAAQAQSTQTAQDAWRDSLTQPRHEAETTLRMRECEQAARWVAAQCAAGVAPGDIMVLARKRDRLVSMEEALRALHIPCVQPEKTRLYDTPEVQDVVALLDVLVSPRHDLSLARALRSPLFGCSDADLVDLAERRRAAGSGVDGWWDLLQKEELLSEHWKARASILRLYQQWLAQWPPHDALHAIYAHGDVLARYAATTPAARRPTVLAHLRALLAAALGHEGGRYLTPYAFVRAMKQGRVRAPVTASAQAVQLLTVHGAKGLEAHSVLLLDTDAKAQRPDTMGVLVDWPGERVAPAHFLFLTSESQPPRHVAGLVAAEQLARQREELHMLYVAMTRARECLAVSATEGASAAGAVSWWTRLSPWMADAVPDAADAPSLVLSADALAPAAWLPQLPVLPDSLRRAPTDLRPEPADDRQARIGEAMHELLEQTPLSTGGPAGAEWPAARLQRLARDHRLSLAESRAAASLATAVLNGEGGWAWDAAQIAQAFNEVPLRHQGQSLRIDRLVQRTHPAALAGWWVLDYKSAAEPMRQPDLVAQLERYRSAVQALMPSAAVHAAFLTGDGRLQTLPAQGIPAAASLQGGAALGHTPAPAAPLATDAPKPPPQGAAAAVPPVQSSLF
ncbi:UvrD-helicase domain-containing protein [Acidovorax lacteus]|uniref:DNA 3'-5' helicase n=1 Tax=Acidovorax lacteus TaxID=1924988 RepID=A0ABP8L1Z8_9BURK